MGCPDGSWGVYGEWPETRRGLGPCFDMTSPPVDGTVLADVETGAFGLVVTLYVTHHHYEVLAWLRTRLSWLHPRPKPTLRWTQPKCT